MSKGFFTIAFLQLSVEYWYFTLIVLLIKYVLIRYVTTNTSLKAIAMWVTGTFVFYIFACIGGFIFSSANYMMIPLLMFSLALIMESVVTTMVFNTNGRKTFFPLLISNFLLFMILFSQVIY